MTNLKLLKDFLCAIDEKYITEFRPSLIDNEEDIYFEWYGRQGERLTLWITDTVFGFHRNQNEFKKCNNLPLEEYNDIIKEIYDKWRP